MLIPARKLSLGFWTFVFLTFGDGSLGQAPDKEWLRVFTEDDSTIEVHRTSLVIEKDEVIGARFRTILSTPESISRQSSAKYQAREDMIRFDLTGRRYRITNTTFFDAAGNPISRGTTESSGWKHLGSGGAGERLLNAAKQLRPFGNWIVLSGRFATGEPLSENDPHELRSLIGSTVSFRVARVTAGEQSCKRPSFEMRGVTNEDALKRASVPLSALSIDESRADALLVSCTTAASRRTFTMVLLLPDDKALMLWDGIFLELERTENLFLP